MSTRKSAVRTTINKSNTSNKFKKEEPVHDADVDGRDEDDEYDDENQEIDMQPIEVKRIPVDQISSLTEEQKNEVFTKVITATNPNLNRHAARFNYSDSQFRSITTSTMDHLSVHFEMDAILIHCDSDEARDQAHLIAEQERIDREQNEKKKQRDDEQSSGTGTVERKDGGESDDEDEFIVPPSDRALKNQFNFSERATQTFNNPKRDREVSTEPPPTSEFSENVTHWEIFDTYVEDFDRQLQAKAAKEKGTTKTRISSYDDDTTTNSTDPNQSLSNIDQIFFSDAMASALKTMERMVNQNAEAEIFHDYAYYEDAPIEHRPSDPSSLTTTPSTTTPHATFLPLWRFQNTAAKRKTVTSIVWNPAFYDLFAVGFGSYDFVKQSDGLIAIYTLKNTQHPEYMMTTESGVMALDFHPQHPSLLVVGLYDGTVCVYDVRSKSNSPIFISENPKVKHTDPVWQVRWQAVGTEEVGNHISFYSISSDGRVTNWIINKNELINEEVISLKLVARSEKEERITEGVLLGLAGGCCFDFNPVSEHLFVVGTEEGALHAYSKAYNSQHIRTFEGHHMAIYSVRWNPFHAGVFLSCSADWTVKLWEVNVPTPIMTFDLNCSVADVAWAPYSSTVFAVITTDGKVRLYDLSINKHEPIGQSLVNKKSKLTHLAFNPRSPVICVGDDHGTVNSLKLSGTQASRATLLNGPPNRDIETEKLEKLMIIPPRQGNINVYVKKEELGKDAKGKKIIGGSPIKGRSVPSSSQGIRVEKKIEEESKENGDDDDKVAE